MIYKLPHLAAIFYGYFLQVGGGGQLRGYATGTGTFAKYPMGLEYLVFFKHLLSEKYRNLPNRVFLYSQGLRGLTTVHGGFVKTPVMPDRPCE